MQFHLTRRGRDERRGLKLCIKHEKIETSDETFSTKDVFAIVWRKLNKHKKEIMLIEHLLI